MVLPDGAARAAGRTRQTTRRSFMFNCYCNIILLENYHKSNMRSVFFAYQSLVKALSSYPRARFPGLFTGSQCKIVLRALNDVMLFRRNE